MNNSNKTWIFGILTMAIPFLPFVCAVYKIIEPTLLSLPLLLLIVPTMILALRYDEKEKLEEEKITWNNIYDLDRNEKND